MSESEKELTVEARGAAQHGVAGLADALAQIFAGMVANRRGPHHLAGMEWQAPEPGVIHPSRHEVDLAWREAFGGFRPPIRLSRKAGDAIEVRARFTAPAPAAAGPVYRGYTLAELAGQYSPRNQADMREVFGQWTRDGGAFRARHGGLDLAYGPSVFERLDLFMPRNVARPPLWIFVHGGYWQASDKDQHAQFAQGMLDAGYAVAMLNYGLAPDTPLAGIAEQVGKALDFLVREGEGLGFDPTRLHVAGHSAGGHLAAALAAGAPRWPVRSALLLSGVFDLEPLTMLPMGRVLGLNDDNLRSLSPINSARPQDLRIAVSVGEKESDEFKRQSADMAVAWNAPAPLILPGAHHFSLLDGLNSGPLLELARATASD